MTAGTIFDKTRTPLKVWMAAAWYLTNQKQGVSALGLQRVLGLGSYQTAWTMLHRFRCAMVRPDRERLKGVVEIDETYLAITDRQQPISAVGRKSKTSKVLAVSVCAASTKIPMTMYCRLCRHLWNLAPGCERTARPLTGLWGNWVTSMTVRSCWAQIYRPTYQWPVCTGWPP